MRISYLAALGLSLATTALADPNYAALRDAELAVLEAQFADFQTASAALADAAKAHCAEGADILPAYRAARTAWAALESYQFGPMEQTGAALSVNFWPDKKGFTNRALTEILSQPQTVQGDLAAISARSAALQGFPALEVLLTDADKPACPLVEPITAHIAQKGAALYDGWFGADGWADLARGAGPDNPIYLSEQEFTGEIFTALNYILFRTQEMALKRPLGDRTGAKPHRAEAWQTGMSLAIITAQLEALEQVVNDGFGAELRAETRDALHQAVSRAARHAEGMLPLDEAVMDPQGLWQLEGLKNRIAYVAMILDTQVGPVLGVESGFSPPHAD